jgi:hypothetical protein
VVFFQDAEVHHHKKARLARLFRGSFVDNLFLHPNSRYAQLDRLIDNFFNEFRAAKDVYDIDLLRDVMQRRVRLLAQDFFNAWIDRDDSITVTLHVGGNAVARTQWTIGKADHRDGVSAAQQVMDRIRLGMSSHARIVPRLGITPCFRVRSFA